jgi:hypothetical protein
MVKKVVLVCISLFILMSIISSLSFLYPIKPGISGRGTTGLVALVVGSQPFNINLTSPKNITYNFTKLDRENNDFRIDLIVSANKGVDTWWYTLSDKRHNEVVNQSVIFTPNTTINAVRWNNELVVYANDSQGNVVSETVSFFVYVPNSAPELINLSSKYYVCEDNDFSEMFSVRDVDEDSLEMQVSPTDPFYIEPLYTSQGDTATETEIFSGILSLVDVGVYEETVSANDNYNSTCCVDTKKVNVTVIEKNDAPDLEDVGVKTLWTVGDNRTLYEIVDVTDEEDGNSSSENITFSLNFLNSASLFNITDEGIINFTADANDTIGVYNISVCVNDSGIPSPHQNISLCGQTGGPIKKCDNFSLTITNENRRPTITSYYPNLTFSSKGTKGLYFNISEYDSDGTVPDAYWYVSNQFKEKDGGSLNDNFTYTFGCGVAGNKEVRVEITDGLLNDSLTWTVNVGYVECPTPPEGGGGGGGGGGIPTCIEKWACGEWQVCQQAGVSLKSGLLSGKDYRDIISDCLLKGWSEESCGVQIRNCYDSSKCNTTISKPEEYKACFYLEEPSCIDGVKNCHDGSCELLVDCGGPCKPCPTCSDGIQNQGEGGVDCGGPCPYPCPEEKPLKKRTVMFIAIIIVNLILILIIVFRVLKIFKLKKRINKIKGE